MSRRLPPITASGASVAGANVTVTDALGRFAIDGVPAGSYELVIWYPPMVRAVEDDRPVWTEPTVVRRRISVGAAETVRAGLALTPTP